MLSPCLGQIAHALLTRPPLESYLPSRRTSSKIPARLACVKHAASVRPEPGSNSYVQSLLVPLFLQVTRQSNPTSKLLKRLLSQKSDCSCLLDLLYHCIVFKDRARFSEVFCSLNARIIIAKRPLFVNPFLHFFSLFRIHIILYSI